jgi:hypothetical protein
MVGIELRRASCRWRLPIPLFRLRVGFSFPAWLRFRRPPCSERYRFPRSGGEYLCKCSWQVHSTASGDAQRRAQRSGGFIPQSKCFLWALVTCTAGTAAKAEAMDSDRDCKRTLIGTVENGADTGSKSLRFEISSGSISKALSSLEEQLWIRRQGTVVLIPEPKRLLREWAEKYKERYRGRLRSSFEITSPFGAKLSDISQGLRPLLGRGYALTGAAASIDAPFVDVDRVEVFLADVGEDVLVQREMEKRRSPLV